VHELLVLDAAVEVVDRGEPEPHDVDRVEYPHGVGQHGAQRRGAGPVVVERRPAVLV
jgi:hypothetical protein